MEGVGTFLIFSVLVGLVLRVASKDERARRLGPSMPARFLYFTGRRLVISKWYTILCLTLLLTCCATERWVPTGKTNEEAQGALSECQQTVFPKTHVFSEPVYLLNPARALEQCMALKGYWLQESDREDRHVNQADLVPPLSHSFQP